jgi:hypothetical protein
MELDVVRITTVTGRVLKRSIPYYTLRNGLGAVEQETGEMQAEYPLLAAGLQEGGFPLIQCPIHPHLLPRTYRIHPVMEPAIEMAFLAK